MLCPAILEVIGKRGMIDMVSMWPVVAGGLGSLGVAGVWLYRRKLVHGTSGSRPDGAERSKSEKADTKVRSGKKHAAMYDNLDTVADWEPVATRVLTVPEREAYAILRKALPEHIILAQVPLARFVKVPTRNSYSEWLRRAGSLCADLVVCDISSQVIAVIEVRQPASKEKERSQRRHVRMDRVLTAARIPVHVWLEGALPGSVVAREAILGAAASTGRTSIGDLNMARRDAEAAAVVAAMQTGGSMHGMSVKESTPVDFNLDELSGRSAQAEDEDDDEINRKDPPPSTWFDDLDTTSPSPLDETPARHH